MAETTGALHFIVYDLGRPWYNGPEIRDQYLRVIEHEPLTPSNREDLSALSDLKSDSYDYIVASWDGTGGTPSWLWRDSEAVRIVFVSQAEVTV